MKTDSKDIPKWLVWPDELDSPDHNLLNESRKEMYTALSHFHNHVKYVIYIMISMPAAILLIMRFWPSEQPNLILYLIAGIILIFILPVGWISIIVIKRYYEVYVSSLVFATKAHIAVGYSQVHP